LIYLKKIIWMSILFVTVLLVFSLSNATPARASDQIPGIAQSFSQYFSPQVLRAADKMMKERFRCQSEGLWRIWTSGFYRK